ncbi:MAG: NAD(+) diphosphatase [Albidovulum sp.]|nr:NAD(+) diphosphatase [Albidovulum sp.]
MRIAEEVTFGGTGYDRAAWLRESAESLGLALDQGTARILPVWRGKIPLRNGENPMLGWVERGSSCFKDSLEPPILLGMPEGIPSFAQDISNWVPGGPGPDPGFLDASKQSHPELPDGWEFVDLRLHMTRLDANEAELAAVAKATLGWHASHQFCARCGQPSYPECAGWRRDCHSCKSQHFCRTDPVVIMLVKRGNSILVGRSREWPSKTYSLLAGFMEPGETAAAAVRREVFEETSVKVGAVEILATQPWPFPTSLMIGCRAEALSSEIKIDPVEIEDAKWLSREEMLDVYAGAREDVAPPRKGAIAHFLIYNWLCDRLG